MTQGLDPVDLAAQAQASADVAEAERLLQIIRDDDFQWVMSTKIGRRFIFRLLEVTGVFRNPYVGSREQTDFKCGEMNVGQRYLADIMRLCPELFHTMIKEQEQHGNRKRTSK